MFNINASGATLGKPLTATTPPKPELLKITNEAGGLVDFELSLSTDSATIVGNYTSAGATRVGAGKLYFHNASVEQTAGQFELDGGNVQLPGLGIRGGDLIGTGVIQGNLVLGYANNNQPNTAPVLNPGGGAKIGVISVEGNFQLASGKLVAEVAGETSYDRLVVSGYAAFVGDNAPPGQPNRVRNIEGNLLPKHGDIAAGFPIEVLSSGELQGYPSYISFDPNTWTWGNSELDFWFTPTADVAAQQGVIAGKAFRDNGALAGVFEQGEAVLAGRTVRLFDEAGTTQLASATTGADGRYQFDDLDAGTYVVEFDRPTGERFAPPDVGSDDERDSDPDPLTGRVTVTLSDDQSDIDAGFYDNAAPIAVDDTYAAHKNTTVSGAVLPNDTDADGDDLTAALATGPSHGFVTLNPDGTFTYTPNTDFSGTDTFTYTVDDGYDGTDTGLVTVTVSGTPAPVGAADSYSAPAELFVPAATGVLSNDTAPNGPLTAVLVSGPSHGTLELNPDGSFLYTRTTTSPAPTASSTARSMPTARASRPPFKSSSPTPRPKPPPTPRPPTRTPRSW